MEQQKLELEIASEVDEIATALRAVGTDTDASSCLLWECQMRLRDLATALDPRMSVDVVDELSEAARNGPPMCSVYIDASQTVLHFPDGRRVAVHPMVFRLDGREIDMAKIAKEQI